MSSNNDGQFKKGQSGNPSGRPPGSRNKATRWAAEMMEGEAEEVIRAVIDKAKGGDPQAMKLVVERVAPRPKGPPAPLELPSLETPEDARTALNDVIQAAANGEITLAEAQAYAGLINQQRQAIDTEDISRELAALKEQLGVKP